MYFRLDLDDGGSRIREYLLGEPYIYSKLLRKKLIMDKEKVTGDIYMEVDDTNFEENELHIK